jgi:hypothetical protein
MAGTRPAMTTNVDARGSAKTPEADWQGGPDRPHLGVRPRPKKTDPRKNANNTQ